ncbi:MAG TPA: hypothetical protein VHA56_07260 [Mucilaginibacter sp.]|nr:hypothetical protein [Mucilaginibacter sp.]
MLGSICAFGQMVEVKGKVSNQKGEPVQYAFVGDIQHNRATFTDSTGTFVLKTEPSSSISVLASNYQDKQVKVDDNNNIDVVLSADGDLGKVTSLKTYKTTSNGEFLRAQEKLVSGSGAMVNKTSQDSRSGGAGGSDVQFARAGFKQEPTRGSRYLFDDWVPGFGIDINDKMVIEKTNMYNYDKIDGTLLYTNDGKSMARIFPGNLKSFTLYDKDGHSHTYVSAPDINGKDFVEVLVNTPKYQLYKKIDSKLIRANYHTDGVLEVGHRYDEYSDIDRYVFVSKGSDKPENISLRKKNLKKLFNGEADAFIAAQGSRDVDDQYVKDLGKSLRN